jgi:hypothetical protein
MTGVGIIRWVQNTWAPIEIDGARARRVAEHGGEAMRKVADLMVTILMAQLQSFQRLFLVLATSLWRHASV